MGASLSERDPRPPDMLDDPLKASETMNNPANGAAKIQSGSSKRNIKATPMQVTKRRGYNACQLIVDGTRMAQLRQSHKVLIRCRTTNAGLIVFSLFPPKRVRRPNSAMADSAAPAYLGNASPYLPIRGTQSEATRIPDPSSRHDRFLERTHGLPQSTNLPGQPLKILLDGSTQPAVRCCRIRP